MASTSSALTSQHLTTKAKASGSTRPPTLDVIVFVASSR